MAINGQNWAQNEAIDNFAFDNRQAWSLTYDGGLISPWELLQRNFKGSWFNVLESTLRGVILMKL